MCPIALNLFNLHPDLLLFKDDVVFSSDRSSDLSEISAILNQMNAGGLTIIGSEIYYNSKFPYSGNKSNKPLYLYDLNAAYGKRIASLKVPIGKPTFIASPNPNPAVFNWKTTIGFVDCAVEILPTRTNLVAVQIPKPKTDKQASDYVYVVGKVDSLVLPCQEIAYLIQSKQLNVLRINKVISFPYQRSIFKPFMRKLYQQRTEANYYSKFFRKKQINNIYGIIGRTRKYKYPMVFNFEPT